MYDTSYAQVCVVVSAFKDSEQSLSKFQFE